MIAFIVLAGFVTGLFFVVMAPIQMYEKWQAESWPSRKGVITRSLARQKFDFSIGRNGTPYWEPEICGTYKTSGEEFCIWRVQLGLHVGNHKWSDVVETVGRYPVGREVYVYYSPDNYKDTTLEPMSSWHEMFIALGVAIGFVMLPWILKAIRR